MALLLKDGLILAGDGQAPRTGSVLIEANRIAAIVEDATSLPLSPETETIDASDSIVLPGLVNAHLHSNEAFEHGAYDNLPLELWLLRNAPPSGGPVLSEREHYLRTMISAVESIKSGVTTVQDDVLDPAEAAVDGAVGAYRDIGLRAVVTSTMLDKSLLDAQPLLRDVTPSEVAAELDAIPVVSTDDQVARFERHFQQWHGVDGRITIIPAPTAVPRCTDRLLETMNAISAERGLPVHIHLNETKTQALTAYRLYGKSVVEHLLDLGMLTPRLTINHGIWLSNKDILLLGEHGCSVTHNPLSNLKLGSGVCPIRELLQAGANLAIGTDGTSTSDTADFMAALRLTGLLHKIGDPDFAQWLSAEEAFRLATQGGAGSILQQDDLGTLEVGKKADVILVDRNAWSFLPLNHVERQIVFSGSSESVRTSVINGKVMMRDRRLTGIDETALKDEVREAGERFRDRHWPKMQAAARRFEPYVRQMYTEAMATPLPWPERVRRGRP